MRQTNTYLLYKYISPQQLFFFWIFVSLLTGRGGRRGQWQRQRQERHHARSLKLSNLILYIYSYLSYHFLNSLSYPLCFTNQIHITKRVIFPLNMFFRKHQIFCAMNHCWNALALFIWWHSSEHVFQGASDIWCNESLMTSEWRYRKSQHGTGMTPCMFRGFADIIITMQWDTGKELSEFKNINLGDVKL